MDLTFHGLRDRISKALESRIPRVPKGARPSRIPRGAWIVPVALILAFWANGGSREEGRLAWLKANPPAIETWRSILSRRDFGPIEDPEWREKAFVEMPDLGRARDSALLSEDRTTLALRIEGDWLFFGLARNGQGGPTVKRELWEPLGIGWEAVARFDRAELPHFRKTAENPKNRGDWRDARSLDY